MVRPAIDGHSGDLERATVVRTATVASSRFNKVQQASLQVVETKGRFYRVSTGDPLSPRRFRVHPENALFSITYVSMRYGQAVEAC
jgi:hypothetical protein